MKPDGLFGIHGKKSLIACALVVMLMFSSCVSLQDREMSFQEQRELQVLGGVETQFTSFQFFHIASKNRLKQKAYAELKRVAQKQYQGNIDIKNISIIGGGSGWELFYSIGSFVLPFGIISLASEVDIGTTVGVTLSGLCNLIGNFQKITATGDVVLVSGSAKNVRQSSVSHSGVDAALQKAVEDIMSVLNSDYMLAIVNVSSTDKDLSEFVAGELEYILLKNDCNIVDRSELDRIRREQNFQLSGDVDDNTIVSIGKFAGADVVITGAITGTGDTRRLRLRVLNTQTARVMSAASERF